MSPFAHNFWYWLLSGVIGLIDAVIVRLPLYQHAGWAVLFYNALVGILTVFVLYFGSFLNLCWFVTLFVIFLTSEGARGLMATYRTVVKLIPFP